MFHPADSYLYHTDSTYSTALESLWQQMRAFLSCKVTASWFNVIFLYMLYISSRTYSTWKKKVSSIIPNSNIDGNINLTEQPGDSCQHWHNKKWYNWYSHRKPPQPSSVLLFFQYVNLKLWANSQIYLLETFSTGPSLQPPPPPFMTNSLSREHIVAGGPSRTCCCYLFAGAPQSLAPHILNPYRIHHEEVTYRGRPARRTSHTARYCSWETLSNLHQLKV